MKKLIISLLLPAGLLLIALLVWAGLQGNSGGSGYRQEAVGVIPGPPQDCRLLPLADLPVNLPPAQVAARLIEAAQQYPLEPRICLQLGDAEHRAYYLADFRNDFLERVAFNDYGTATKTTWRGRLRARLSFAAQADRFSGEGFSEPVSRNLYH